MTTLETVRGPVDVASLGPTLMHEHVFVLSPEAFPNYGSLWGESYSCASTASRPSSTPPCSASAATSRVSSG